MEIKYLCATVARKSYYFPHYHWIGSNNFSFGIAMFVKVLSVFLFHLHFSYHSFHLMYAFSICGLQVEIIKDLEFSSEWYDMYLYLFNMEILFKIFFLEFAFCRIDKDFLFPFILLWWVGKFHKLNLPHFINFMVRSVHKKGKYILAFLKTEDS